MKATEFSVTPLSEEMRNEMINWGVWHKECPVPLDRLRLVKFTYYGFDNKTHQDGEIVVLDAVSGHVSAIFKALLAIKFPLAKACRMEKYNGDDEASLADNNTAGFQHREITGGGPISLYAYGLAIDINPHQNPYISLQENMNVKQGFAKVIPAEGLNYINRKNVRPGMAEIEGVVDIFKKHGFTIWGGQWNTPIDWQHFQTSRAMAQLLAVMLPADAEQLFEMYVVGSKLLNSIDPKDNKIQPLYSNYKEKFMQVLNAYPEILQMDVDIAIEHIKDKCSS